MSTNEKISYLENEITDKNLWITDLKWKIKNLKEDMNIEITELVIKNGNLEAEINDLKSDKKLLEMIIKTSEDSPQTNGTLLKIENLVNKIYQYTNRDLL